MIEAWLPTAVSAAALGIVVWYIKIFNARLQQQIDRLEARLGNDEQHYLTEKAHDQICSGNTAQVKLHINEIMDKVRTDLDEKFRQIWKRLDELKDMVKEVPNKK